MIIYQDTCSQWCLSCPCLSVHILCVWGGAMRQRMTVCTHARLFVIVHGGERGHTLSIRLSYTDWASKCIPYSSIASRAFCACAQILPPKQVCTPKTVPLYTYLCVCVSTCVCVSAIVIPSNRGNKCEMFNHLETGDVLTLNGEGPRTLELVQSVAKRMPIRIQMTKICVHP